MTYTEEQTIRDLIANWQEATRAGDLPLLLSLTAEDVVFLTPGQPPMRGRDAFAAAVETALQHFHVESSAKIEEIQIAADLAYCWSYLSVTLKPLPNGSPSAVQVTRLRYCANSRTEVGLCLAMRTC